MVLGPGRIGTSYRVGRHGCFVATAGDNATTASVEFEYSVLLQAKRPASGAIRSRSAAYRIKDNRVQVESAIAYSEAWPVSKLAHLTLLLQNTVSSQTWSKIFSVSIWKRSTMFRFYSFFASSVACASPLTLSVRIAACIQSVSRRIHPFLVVAYFLLVRLL